MKRAGIIRNTASVCVFALLLSGCTALLPQSGVPGAGIGISSATKPPISQGSDSIAPESDSTDMISSKDSVDDTIQDSTDDTIQDKGETQAPASEVASIEEPMSSAETQVASSSAVAGGFKRPEMADVSYNKDLAEQVGNGVEYDLSSVSKGYVGVSCTNNGKRLRFRVSYGEASQTYELRGDGVPEFYPLQSGNGEYKLITLQNTTGKEYMRLAEPTVNVTLENEFQPYIRPSQMVKYNKDSSVVKLANKMGESAKNEEALVAAIYDYIKKNIKYDYDKAKKAAAGEIPTYLPNPDDTLATNSGICFDYAAIAAAMLRSQGIPTKMLTGYVQEGKVYHAWNLIYLKESGWIAVEIKAPAKTWYTIDLTFAANGADTKFIGSGDGYVQRYVY